MKLVQITNRYYLLFTSIILAIASTLLFLKLQNVSAQQQGFNLIVKNQQIVNQIKNGGSIPNLPPYIEVKVLEKYTPDTYRLGKTYVLNPYENEKEAYKEFVCYQKINNKNYKIITRSALLDADDYFSDVLVTIVIIFIVIFIGLSIINLLVTKKIWQVFHDNLKQIKNFNVEKTAAIQLKKTNISEFKELNNSIEVLVEKAQKEFTSLKEFTENASHELQTPLAVIQSNIENLIQHLNLNEQQSKMLENIGNATNRMSNLTKGLLLLAKIDNHQYEKKAIINITEIIHHQILFYDDLIQAKSIALTTQINNSIKVEANKFLIEILISNLINNAIKHNIEKGEINISLSNKKLEISNTGDSLITTTNSLFDRFKKSSTKNNSIGLGLAIVKKISDFFNWEISYKYADNWHTITINF